MILNFNFLLVFFSFNHSCYHSRHCYFCLFLSKNIFIILFSQYFSACSHSNFLNLLLRFFFFYFVNVYRLRNLLRQLTKLNDEKSIGILLICSFLISDYNKQINRIDQIKKKFLIKSIELRVILICCSIKIDCERSRIQPLIKLNKKTEEKEKKNETKLKQKSWTKQ